MMTKYQAIPKESIRRVKATLKGCMELERDWDRNGTEHGNMK